MSADSVEQNGEDLQVVDLDESATQASPAQPPKRRRPSAKQQLAGLAKIRTFIVNHITEALDEERRQELRLQAEEHRVLEGLQDAPLPDWAAVVALVKQQEDRLKLDLPDSVETDLQGAKRRKKATWKILQNQQTAESLESESKPKANKRSASPAASPPFKKAKGPKPKPNQAGKAPSDLQNVLRVLKRNILTAFEERDDLTQECSYYRQKIISIATEAKAVPEFALAKSRDIDWQALLAHIENLLNTTEEKTPPKKRSKTANKKRSNSLGSSRGRSASPPVAAAFDEKESISQSHRRSFTIRCLNSVKSHIVGAVGEGDADGAHKKDILSLAGQHGLLQEFDLPSYSGPDLQALLPHIEAQIGQLEAEKKQLARERKLAKRSLPQPTARTTPASPLLPAKAKTGRQKQRPTPGPPAKPTPSKPGRKKPIAASAPQPFPVLEADEGTRQKLEVLREIRAIAWEDAHLKEGFSSALLDQMRALDRSHTVLGPNGAALLDGYLEDGPKPLLMHIKGLLDRLERGKRRDNAFDIMRRAAQACSKGPPKPAPSKKQLFIKAERDLSAAERFQRGDVEKEEREAWKGLGQALRDEGKRMREEEKARREEQRRLEREEEKRKKEAERLQKEEEKKKKKEYDKKAPKVLDQLLEHPKELPPPCYNLDFDSDLFLDLMQTYHFVYLFAEELQVTRFPFQLWVQAVTAFNENKIIEEVVRQLVDVCEMDRSEGSSRRGGNWFGNMAALLAGTVRLSKDTRTPKTSKRVANDSDSSEEDVADACQVCGKRTPVKQLTECELCERQFHLGCLDPPLEDHPDEDWQCPECAEAEESKESSSEKKAEAEEPDVAELKALCARAQELGRHNTFPNWGVPERLQWLKQLVRVALTTEAISEAVRGNTAKVAALQKDFRQRRIDLQTEEAAAVKELAGKKEDAEGDTEPAEGDAPEKAEEEEAPPAESGGGPEGDKEKGPPKAPKDREKEREERERRRAEMAAIREKFRPRHDELLLRHRQAMEATQARTFPLGEDRYRRLYWRFPGDPNLWVQEVKGQTLEAAQPAADALKPLVEEEDTTTDRAWGYWRAVDEVLAALDDRGIRESKLKVALEPVKWCDDRCPDRLQLPRHFQLRYYINKYKSTAFQKHPLEWQ